VLAAGAITVSAGGKTLLKDATLEVRPGEFLALAGENGAGKSTLLRVLAGDLRPKSGQIGMNGYPLERWRLRERAHLRAVLPQDSAVAFGFTALETALMGRYPHCDGMPGECDRRIAREALERLDAAHLEQRLVTTLSGGERARVALARALAQIWEADERGPRYLLLDEPVASLDLAHQHNALRLVREFVRERGVGAVAVLHDLNLAAQYADRIAVLKAGRLAACGAPDAVLTERLVADCFAVRALVMRHPRTNCPLVIHSPEAE
jgi:iron complex transport system ATP-binding protein